jgi:hypothetical protein
VRISDDRFLPLPRLWRGDCPATAESCAGRALSRSLPRWGTRPAPTAGVIQMSPKLKPGENPVLWWKRSSARRDGMTVFGAMKKPGDMPRACPVLAHRLGC